MALDEDHPQPQVGGPEGGGVTTGTGADHDDIAVTLAGVLGGGGRGRRGFARSLQRGDPAPFCSSTTSTLPSETRSPTLTRSCATTPGERRRHIHRRLIGFQRDQWILGRDLVARRNVDLDHRDVVEVADVRDRDLDAAHSSARRRSESTRTRCTTNLAAAAPSITRWS